MQYVPNTSMPKINSCCNQIMQSSPSKQFGITIRPIPKPQMKSILYEIPFVYPLLYDSSQIPLQSHDIRKAALFNTLSKGAYQFKKYCIRPVTSIAVVTLNPQSWNTGIPNPGIPKYYLNSRVTLRLRGSLYTQLKQYEKKTHLYSMKAEEVTQLTK